MHEEIHALLHRAFAFMDGRIAPPSSLHRLTPKDIAAQARDGEVWVISAPVAACVFLSKKPNCLYIGKLAVDLEARGAGHGRRLIQLAEKRARHHGLPILELETRIELIENHAAFRAMGFVTTQKTAHEGFSQPTGIVMQKGL